MLEALEETKMKHIWMDRMDYQGRSRGLFHHDKRNVVRQQVSTKCDCQEQRLEEPRENYQTALKKDIAKLQKQLKQEVDTHRTLERALTRTLGALPRFSPGLATEVQKLVAEVAVLEEEVVHLEEFIMMLHQGLLDSAALFGGHYGQMQQPTSQMRPILAERQASTLTTQSGYIREKRSSAIAKLLPPMVDTTSAKPVSSVQSPMYGEPRQKLNRSSSFRR